MAASSATARQWIPLVVLACVVAGAYLSGLHRLISLQSLADNRQALDGFVGTHFALALLSYAALYCATVALSLPGATFLTVAGGFVFGWAVSAPVSVLAATAGAVIVFHIVKSSLGKAVAERAGALAARLAQGFARDGFNYLLFLRLVPAFPFFAVNAAAGLSSMKTSTFTWATLIGIIPGTIAFSWLGRGLGSIIDVQRAAQAACRAADPAADCPLELSLSSLLTFEMAAAFTALGVVALIPLALRKWQTQR